MSLGGQVVPTVLKNSTLVIRVGLLTLLTFTRHHLIINIQMFQQNWIRIIFVIKTDTALTYVNIQSCKFGLLANLGGPEYCSWPATQ